MAQTVAKIKRKPGKLYFVDGSGNVKETSLNRNGRKKSTAAKKKTSSKKRKTTKRK